MLFRIFFFLPVAFLVFSVSFGQAVGFGTTTPHPSALVDFTSNNKGVLVPRLTSAQRTGIAAPAPGLLVYDTNTNSFWFFNGAVWSNLSTGTNSWGVNGTDIFNTNTGRVGIGVQSPTARLTVDSGMVVDYSNSNSRLLTGRNVGLFFGNPAGAGITSIKDNGSALRSGLSFWAGGFQRMAIDTLGRVGIGIDPFNEYRLFVNGLARFTRGATSSMYIGNTFDDSEYESTLLYLKGRSQASPWGQHIIMEATGSSDSAAILFDGDGMKFRIFSDNGDFFFRNSNNTTTARVDEEGNLTTTGTVTAAGRGIVSTPNTGQWQVREVIVPTGLSLSDFGPGAVINIPFTISGFGFTQAPHIISAELTGVSNIVKQSTVVIPFSATTSVVTITLRNVGTTIWSDPDFGVRLLVMGPR